MRHSRKTFRDRQEHMLRQLRDDILSGQRPVGQYLPSEKSLAELFGLSNKSVRQMLDVLVEEQLIEKTPRVGNVVVNRPGQETVTLKLGHHGISLQQETELRTLLDDFHKLHPNIRVQDVAVPSNSPELLKRYIDYGMIDVITLNDMEFHNFVETDSLPYLAPLPGKSDIHSFLTKTFTHGGDLYVQPFVFSPTVLCYNKDHFRQAKLTEPDSGWSWDDLFRAADRLALPRERIGFYFNASQNNRVTQFLLQSGARFERGRDGKFRICGTAIMDALREFREIVTNKLAPVYQETNQGLPAEELFLKGRTSMILTTYFGLNHLRGSNVAYDVAAPPGGALPVSLLIGIGLAVNRQSPNKEAAFALVDYLTSVPAQNMIRERTLSIPALKLPIAAVRSEETVNRPSRFDLYREIIPTYRLGSDLGLNDRERKIFFTEVAMYWSGFDNEISLCRRLEDMM